MTRHQLIVLLRHAAEVCGTEHLILAGSQAIYAASYSSPEFVERSEEADLLLVGAQRELFVKLQNAWAWNPHIFDRQAHSPTPSALEP
ncbi:MAG TPA: hypothetical protein VMZ27_10005 [Candidatus Saccharimonadales bacterium]|nr:hypothetical protein [Candidatus Saccharimonadales bacterium]